MAVTALAFCNTTAEVLALFVTLWIETADPVVPPVSPYRICVLDAVTELFVIVKVKVAPAAIDGEVIVICPDLPFKVAVVVPEVVPEFRTNPFPAAEQTKLPAVAVILPVVAVTVVLAEREPAVALIFPAVATMSPAVAVILPVLAVRDVVAVTEVVAVIDPGAINADGILKVTVAPDAAEVISLAVPAIFMLPATGVAVPVSAVSWLRSPALPAVTTQFAEVTPLVVVYPNNS